MNELVKGAGSIDMSNFAAWFNNYYQQNLGAYNTYVGVLSPQMLVDTLHIWGPLLTLFVFMFLGPGAGLAANGVGNRAATNGVGNRAWIAFSAAITIRQLILWFFNLPPIKALLRAIGIEIVPAGNRGRSSSGARTSFVGVEGDGIAMRTTGGNAVGVAPLGSVRHCEASKYESVANVPTAFSSRVEGEVQLKDYLEFKDRVKFAPERLPTVEQSGEWTEMMAKSQNGMAYRAWRHIYPYGGTEYLSTTTFEHCTVEEMCDFFNCDETRASWDRLLYRHRTLERDERTGAECVFWERALPVISNRDYVFSRRTWKESTPGGDVYWAITKGCTHSQTPETPKVKRVDPYFSMWRMRAVPGRDGRLTSAECLLSHFEEQHVNQDVARFAVKCGMWGVVKNMDAGFRKFQRERAARLEASGATTIGSRGRASLDACDMASIGEGCSRGGVKGLNVLRKLAVGGVISAICALSALDAMNRRGGDGDRGIRSDRSKGRSKRGLRRRHGQHAVCHAADGGDVVDPKFSIAVGDEA